MSNVATLPEPVKSGRPSLDPDRRATLRELVSVRSAKHALNSLIRNAEAAGESRLVGDLLLLAQELSRQQASAWERAVRMDGAA
jgi:hypothetical protein